MQTKKQKRNRRKGHVVHVQKDTPKITGKPNFGKREPKKNSTFVPKPLPEPGLERLFNVIKNFGIRPGDIFKATVKKIPVVHHKRKGFIYLFNNVAEKCITFQKLAKEKGKKKVKEIEGIVVAKDIVPPPVPGNYTLKDFGIKINEKGKVVVHATATTQWMREAV